MIGDSTCPRGGAKIRKEFKREGNRITGIDLIAENEEDKALLELLWWKDIKRKYLIYRKHEVRLETEVSDRK